MSRNQIQEKSKRKKNEMIGQDKHRLVEKQGDEEVQEKSEAGPTAQANKLSRIWVLPVDNHADLLLCSLLLCRGERTEEEEEGKSHPARWVTLADCCWSQQTFMQHSEKRQRLRPI